MHVASEIGNMAVNIAQDMKKPYMVEVVACVWDTLWYYGKPLEKSMHLLQKYKMQKGSDSHLCIVCNRKVFTEQISQLWCKYSCF